MAYSLAIKWPKPEADNRSVSNARVTVWSFTSTSAYWQGAQATWQPDSFKMSPFEGTLPSNIIP
jgi:hypothetical protein